MDNSRDKTLRGAFFGLYRPGKRTIERNENNSDECNFVTLGKEGCNSDKLAEGGSRPQQVLQVEILRDS